MPLTTLTASTRAKASVVNGNFALCVLTDTAKTVTVTHTWTAAQTFTGGFTAAADCSISSTLEVTGLLTGAQFLTTSGTTSVTGGTTTNLFNPVVAGTYYITWNYTDDSAYGTAVALKRYASGNVISSTTDANLVINGSQVALVNAGATKSAKWSYIFIPLPA